MTTLISRENLSKKKLGEKLVEMLGFFVKIEFLEKNLTFRIVYVVYFPKFQNWHKTGFTHTKGKTLKWTETLKN